MAFQFELVSPERLLFSDKAVSVIVPGSEGEFTVLEDHAPLMSLLKPGILTVESAESVLKFVVWGGFADVEPTGLTVLADKAVLIEDVDLTLIDADIKELEEDVADAQNEDERSAAAERLSQLVDVRAALAP